MDGIPQDRLQYIRLLVRHIFITSSKYEIINTNEKPELEPMLTTGEWVHHFAPHQLLTVDTW